MADQDFIPDNHFVSDEETYGTPGQIALTAAEGAAKGFVGPIATLAEKGLTKLGVPGLTPEEQAGREDINPWTHGVSEVAGLGAGLLTGTGEARILEGGAEAAVKIAGMAAKPVTTLAKIGGGALRGAVGTALYQTGDEISKRINDPSLSLSSAVAHIGLSGLIGAGSGGVLGAISPFWSKANEEPIAQAIQDFKNTTEGTVADQIAEGPAKQIHEANLSSRLSRQKPNSSEIVDIAQRNQWPLAEGMTSESKEIQMAEDALLNGPPTVASVARRKVYQDAYDAAATSVDRAVAEGSEAMSETQAGNALKSSLTGKLEAENEPIKKLYSAIEPYQQAIPLTDRSSGALSRGMEKLIEEKGLVPGSERYNFVKTFADGIDSVDNLQKLKNFRTEVGRSAGPLTKDLAGAINEKLNGVEERAIRRFAETMQTSEAKDKVLGLVKQLDEAKGKYSAFKGKLQTLGKSMGKKNVYGPQDFIDFVDDLNPQTLAKRLFNENNTEFSTYFAKHFPDEMGIMRGYQRGLIRSNALKSGSFSPAAATKEILGMEPEMQKLLFTPNEIQTIEDAKKYLGHFPKSFNPSGTAHETAFRAFFEHPTGAVIANLRDYGIQSFIKAFGRASPGADSEAGKILPLMGDAVGSKDVNPHAFKHAVDYAMSVIKGDASISRAAKSALTATVPVAATRYPEEHEIKRLDHKLKEFQNNSDLYASAGGHVGHYLPNHDIAIKGAVSGAVSYLNGIRPATQKASPLDPEIEPTDEQKANFSRALAIAEKPLSVISLLREGRLTSQDMAHLRALYPGMADRIGQKITEEMMNHVSSERPVPYQTRMGLSTLLGQPMDSSLSPQAITSNQSAFVQAAQQEAQRAKPSQKGMAESKYANRFSLSHSNDEP